MIHEETNFVTQAFIYYSNIVMTSFTPIFAKLTDNYVIYS